MQWGEGQFELGVGVATAWQLTRLPRHSRWLRESSSWGPLRGSSSSSWEFELKMGFFSFGLFHRMHVKFQGVKEEYSVRNCLRD